MKKSLLWLVIDILLFLVLVGCGYRFAGSGEIPGKVQRIFIEVLENKTSEPGIENIITQDLISEFIRRRKDILADRLEDADAILNGKVANLTIKTISPKSVNLASERRVTVWLSLKLAKPDGKVLWIGRAISDNQAYLVSDDKSVTERNKRTAIQQLSPRLAERSYNRLTDNF